MPRKLSTGLLPYRRVKQDDQIVLEVLLGHMGGPFWARKDDGEWSIPKGEYEPAEDPFAAAKREFLLPAQLTALLNYVAVAVADMRFLHAAGDESEMELPAPALVAKRLLERVTKRQVPPRYARIISSSVQQPRRRSVCSHMPEDDHTTSGTVVPTNQRRSL